MNHYSSKPLPRMLPILLAIVGLMILNSCMDKKMDNPFDPVEQNLFVPMPVFNPPGGTYQANKYVSITCSMPDTQIFYSLDGSTPTQSSQPYHNPMWISLGSTLKARAFRTDYPSSPVATASYTYGVAMPTFNPPGGTYFGNITVSIIPDSVGTIIRYTTNGSEPSASSALYENPISINSPTTLKARSYKDGLPPSSTATASYAFTSVLEGFVLVEGGTFTMGRTTGSGGSEELPTHSVTLNSFYIGKYEVTQAEFSQYLQPGYSWTSSYGLGDNYPAYYVSWYAVLKYCNLRSMAEGLTPVYSISGSTNPASWGTVPTSNNSTWNAAICNWSANGYRLPTEAEWEYAARGGTNNPDYLYSGSDDINAVAWYQDNSGSSSHVVGTRSPNGLGTYDMSGNLYEWTWDWYGNYSSGSQSNPTGPGSGSARVRRGGDWDKSATSCRVADRYNSYPYYIFGNIGLRLCRASL